MLGHFNYSQRYDLAMSHGFCILVLMKSQVSGLVCCVHDGTTLKEKFNKLVKADESLMGDKTALDC